MADRRKSRNPRNSQGAGRNQRSGRSSGYSDSPRYVKRVHAPNRKFARFNRVKMILIFSILVIAMAGLIIRLNYINFTRGNDYARRVLSQMNYDGQQIPYKRGDILDRNGTVLATSERVYNLVIDSYVMLNSKVKEDGDCFEPSLEALKNYFSASGINIDEIKNYVKSNPENRYYVPIKHLTYSQVQPYNELFAVDEESGNYVNKDAVYVKGIWFEEEYIRKYPYGDLAGDVLGYTYSGNVGAYGLEEYYNEELNGTNGREYGYLNDGILERSVVNPVNGNSIVTTLDINVQQIIHKHLEEFNEAVGTLNSAVIVQNVNTGELLGMESYPFIDPSDPYNVQRYVSEERWNEMTEEEKMKARQVIWRNFCISDTYEPGSTVKTVTVASALDQNIVTPENVFLCDGGMNFQDGLGVQTVSCINRSGHGSLDLSHTLQYSCNDAIMQIGLMMGQETMVKTWSTFGLGLKTNIDLPGESSGIIRNASMSEIDLAICSFGQSYNITMVQVASTFASIVNGGNYYRPHLVSEIRSDGGSIVQNFEKELVRTTVSAQTSDWMKTALEETITNPSAGGHLAYIEGYRIGGKTGTAEKIPRNQGNYLVSFISAAPIDNPQYMIYVVLDEAAVSESDSRMAVVMSRKIWEDLLPYLQIFPEGAENEPMTEVPVETGENGESTTEDSNEAIGSESETLVETDENGKPLSGEEDNYDNVPETVLSPAQKAQLLRDYQLGGRNYVIKKEYIRE